jgi:superfamily II DNA/RNA helicase
LFESYGLERSFIDLLAKNNISEPSGIQKLALAPILQGQDVLVQSPTGSGKTLAYLLPGLQRIERDVRQLQVLVVVPSQELGMQIYREIETYGVSQGIRAISLIGSAAIKRQLDKLKDKPQIAVGTPGRIVELVNMKKLSLHHVRTLILDEVDQLFTLGNGADVERVVKATLRDRQTVAVSATIAESSKARLQAMMKPAAVQCKVDVQAFKAESTGVVKHGFFLAEPRDHIDVLRKAIHAMKVKHAIIFVSDPNRIMEVADKLRFNRLAAAPLYGEAGKQERASVIDQFRRGQIHYLVTTDVASRGLDFDFVTHVFQMDLPRHKEGYIHRSGRTGRMGKSGTVVSIVGKAQVADLKRLARQAEVELEPWVLGQGKVSIYKAKS